MVFPTIWIMQVQINSFIWYLTEEMVIKVKV